MREIDNLRKAKKIYEEYIYGCNQLNSRKSLWWYTPSSSRERLGSFVQDDFVEEFFLENFLIKTKKVQINRKSILAKKFPFIKSLLSLIRDCSIIFKFILRKKRIDLSKKTDVVFVHPLHNIPVRHVEGKIWNHYFGELPGLYINLGKKIEIFGPLDPELLQTENIVNENEYFVSNILKYLKMKDVLIILLKIFQYLILARSFPEPKNLMERKLKKLLKKETLGKLYNLFWGLIYQISFERYIKSAKPNIVFHTYENNWWERGFNIACRNNPNIVKKQIGYLHCSILDSHLKYTLLDDEWNLKPSPDEILTTGPVASEILKRRGSYPFEKILTGYDLRGPNLFQIHQRKERSSTIRNILILLEGLNTMPNFLKLVLDSIGKMNFHLHVRCHPVFPIEQPEFKEIRNHGLFSKLTISQNKALEEDLGIADLVVYKGTTSVLYAGYMGIPLMKFVDNWWASDDPLVGCDNLKKEFSNSSELISGIKYFEELDDEKYNFEKKNIQNYVFSYMRPYQNNELTDLAVSLLN